MCSYNNQEYGSYGYYNEKNNQTVGPTGELQTTIKTPTHIDVYTTGDQNPFNHITLTENSDGTTSYYDTQGNFLGYR